MIHSSEKGFSMIEVLIALFLISIVIVACMLLYGTSIKTSFTNTTQNNAIRLAQQTIESLKQYDQLELNRLSPIWTAVNSPLNTFSQDIDGITYQVTQQIIPNQNLSANIMNDNDYIPIRITVNWNFQGTYQLVVDTCLIRWL